MNLSGNQFPRLSLNLDTVVFSESFFISFLRWKQMNTMLCYCSCKSVYSSCVKFWSYPKTTFTWVSETVSFSKLVCYSWLLSVCNISAIIAYVGGYINMLAHQLCHSFGRVFRLWWNCRNSFRNSLMAAIFFWGKRQLVTVKALIKVWTFLCSV